MKPLVAFAVFVIAGRLLADTTTVTAKPATPVQVTTTTTAATKPGAKPDANAKPEDPQKKKVEELGIIKGTEIKRDNGTYLGLQVVNSNFVLSFYNKKKKPMAIDVTRATARWPNVRGPGDNRTVLNVSGTALVGAKPVLPPYTYNVYITLLKGDGEDAKAVENFVVQFRG